MAARGLDIPEVDLVVQTEPPSVRERGMGGREKGRGGRGRGGRRETCSVIIVSYYVTLFLSPVPSTRMLMPTSTALAAQGGRGGRV